MNTIAVHCNEHAYVEDYWTDKGQHSVSLSSWTDGMDVLLLFADADTLDAFVASAARALVEYKSKQ
jgi:hypothetical protein